MTKRVDRLLEIVVVGYFVISLTQVLVAGSPPLPQWLTALGQAVG